MEKPHQFTLTLNRAAILQRTLYTLPCAQKSYDFSGDKQERGRLYVMPLLQSGAPDLHLERARDHVGGSRTAWCTDYWRGECPVRGWWQRGSQKSNKPSKPPKIHENGQKTGGFVHVLAYKSPKTPFFAQKNLTRYTHETFFEKYVNFPNHYLSHCGVMPVQSFGSHIRPQPHGLGLRCRNKFYDLKRKLYFNLKNKISVVQSMLKKNLLAETTFSPC